MEDKHYKILDFLSKQTGPISYKDFPEEIQEDFRYRDTPHKEGSLLFELQLIINRSKKWVDTPTQHHYILNEVGKNALQREITVREESALKEKQTYEKLTLEIEDLRNKVFDYDQTKSNAKLSLKVSIATVIVTIVLQIIQWQCKG